MRLVAAADSWLDRRGVTAGAPRDRLLAVALGLVSAVVMTLLLGLPAIELGPISPAAAVAVVATTVVQCLLLAVRRSHPRACLWAVAVLQVVVVALVPADVALRGPAGLVAAYTVGTLLAGRAATRAVGAAIAVEVLGGLAVGVVRGTLAEALLGALGSVVVLSAAGLAGVYVGTHRRYVALMRERAAALEAAQETKVQAAIGAERTRMARELHDVAAHHLSGMVVQAAAVQRLIDVDPAAAREGIGSIRRQGRRTLEDLRMLVGVLRDPDAVGDHAPVPGLARLEELVADARAVGADVTLTVRGAPRDLPPLADVTCYRLVQEALSNSRQHAPGAPVRVVVEHGDAVTVTVDDDGDGTTTTTGLAGVGLVGMRERAQLVGATLQAGPRDGGGWRVRAVVPRREEER